VEIGPKIGPEDRIKPGKRFVQKPDRDGAGREFSERDPLPLAAGKLMRASG
jgi:hypothetical protein